MKNFLLFSHYAPREGIDYTRNNAVPGRENVNCAASHRTRAHREMQALGRFWEDEVSWKTIEVENTKLDRLMHEVRDYTWDAIWFSGSPYLLREADQYEWIKNALSVAEYLIEQQETPLIGICFGQQLLAQASRAQVTPAGDHHLGERVMYDAAGESLITTMVDHEDCVTNLPLGTSILGKSACGMPYLLQMGPKVLATQVHPEISLHNPNEAAKAEAFWREQLVRIIGT